MTTAAATPIDAQRNPYEDEGTIRKWKQDYYQPISERFYDAAVPRLLTRMGAKPGDRVLDGGCGTGVHSVRAARFGCRTMGVDLSNAMLNVARENAHEAGLSNQINFQQEDLTTLSLETESFDHVFSWGVIIHIPDIGKGLEQLVRVLKPGGSLGLYVTNRGALDHKIERVARKLLGKPAKPFEASAWGEGHWHEMPGGKMWTIHVDARQITEHLQQLGLKRTHRYAGEFTEMQKNLGGFTRRTVLRLNNLLFKIGAPASLSSGQFMVFHKQAS